MARSQVAMALGRALRAMKLAPEDAATVELARTYARAIDQGTEDLSKVGPKLLDALAALGMTPAARAALVKGAPAPPAKSPLDELRAKREQKQTAGS